MDNELGARKLPIIEFLYMLVYASYTISPELSKLPAVPFFGITFCYLFYVIIRSKTGNNDNKILTYVLIAVYISLLYFLLTETQTIDNKVDNYVLKLFIAKFQQMLYQIIPFVVMYRLLTASSIIQCRIFLGVSFVCFAYTIWITNIFMTMYPGVVRSFANSIEVAEETKGIGNFYFIYGTAALLPTLALVFVTYKNKIIKILVSVSILLIYSFLMKAEFSLSIIIPTISISYFCYKQLPEKNRPLIFLGIPVLFFLLPIFFRFVADNVEEGNDIKDRFMELSLLFSFQDTGGTAQDGTARMEIYSNAIRVFLSSPIWGQAVDFDPHSTFFGFLCDIGLIGAIPYFFLYYSMNKYVYKYLNLPSESKYFKISFLFIILMGFTNPVHSTSALQFVIWCIAPLVINEILKYNAKYKI